MLYLYGRTSDSNSLHISKVRTFAIDVLFVLYLLSSCFDYFQALYLVEHRTDRTLTMDGVANGVTNGLTNGVTNGVTKAKKSMNILIVRQPHEET